MGYTEDTLEFYTKTSHEYVITYTVHLSAPFELTDGHVLYLFERSFF